jgi:hypothetical protein
MHTKCYWANMEVQSTLARARRRWEDDIKMDVSDLERDGVDFIRSLWLETSSVCAVINTAVNLGIL